VSAGEIELVDGAALAEDVAAAARVDGDDRARRGSRPEVDARVGVREGADRRVGGDPVAAHDQPIALAAV
jgi:hypothetical protein